MPRPQLFRSIDVRDSPLALIIGVGVASVVPIVATRGRFGHRQALIAGMPAAIGGHARR